MGKTCRVKQRTKTSNKRKSFLGMKRQLVNNVNTGINLSTVNNESENDSLNIHHQSDSTTATATFATSNKTFSTSQTPSVSSTKVDDIEKESPKTKESIPGNHFIDVNMF